MSNTSEVRELVRMLRGDIRCCVEEFVQLRRAADLLGQQEQGALELADQYQVALAQLKEAQDTVERQEHEKWALAKRPDGYACPCELGDRPLQWCTWDTTTDTCTYDDPAQCWLYWSEHAPDFSRALYRIALLDEARSSVRLDGETHCVEEEASDANV